MKKSLILGYGITGKSFANYLTKKKLNFEIYDKNFEFEVLGRMDESEIRGCNLMI